MEIVKKKRERERKLPRVASGAGGGGGKNRTGSGTIPCAATVVDTCHLHLSKPIKGTTPGEL